MLKKLVAVALASTLVFTGTANAMAYTVQKGDTMFELAEKHEMSLEELSSLNPEVYNLDLIFVGQTLNTNKNDLGKVVKPVKPIQTAKKVAPKVAPKTEVKQPVAVNGSELDLLARIVSAEARGESYAGKLAVANVVLNRVESSQFPNSLEGVIYQKGQFSPVTNGSINRQADSESVQASKEALAGVNNVGNALFFYNPKTATSRWLDSKPTKAVIGNHHFK